jgi:hypothetical protein
VAVGNSHSYIGMQVTVANEEVVLDMRFYLHSILEGFDNLRVVATPGGKPGFAVDPRAKALDKEDKKLFHMMVAKPLYLSKRARLDIISMVSFLCLTVKEPTTED